MAAKSCSINDMPEEILLEILKFCAKDDLCRLSFVCKKFRRIVSDYSLKNNYVLTPQEALMNFKDLSKFIRKDTMDFKVKFDPFIMCDLPKRFIRDILSLSNLKKLSLHGVAIKPWLLNEELKMCHNGLRAKVDLSLRKCATDGVAYLIPTSSWIRSLDFVLEKDTTRPSSLKSLLQCNFRHQKDFPLKVTLVKGQEWIFRHLDSLRKFLLKLDANVEFKSLIWRKEGGLNIVELVLVTSKDLR